MRLVHKKNENSKKVFFQKNGCCHKTGEYPLTTSATRDRITPMRNLYSNDPTKPSPGGRCQKIHDFEDVTYQTKTWDVESVKNFVVEQLRFIQNIELKNSPKKYATWLEDQVVEIPTKNGVHIITPPFNLQRAQLSCNLMFEGVKTFEEQIIDDSGKCSYVNHKCVGWLHKDGMTPIYIP